MATWVAIVNGTSYTLNDRNPFDVVSVQGIGIAPTRRLTQRGPLQHGETDIGYRLDPRQINLVLAFATTQLSYADGLRDTIAHIFGPGHKVQLRCTRSDASVRQIDCYTVGLTDMPITDDDRVGAFQRTAIQLVAPNPLWYDPTAEQGSITPPGDWWLAAGAIEAANVITHEVNIVSDVNGNPWAGSGWVAHTQWSVVIKASYVDDGNDYQYWMCYDGAFAPPTFERKLMAVSASDKWIYGSALHDGSVLNFLAGTANATQRVIAVICNGPDINLYADGILQWSAPGIGRFLPTGTRIWGDYIPGTFSYAAAYNIALSPGQLTALQAAMDASFPELAGVIVNVGNADAFPVIQLQGEMQDPIITNVTTGEVLDFTGYDVPALTYNYINTAYGQKTVKGGDGTSLIDKLTSASDLATFHLQPGPNYITVQSASTLTAADVLFTFYKSYLSL